MQTEYDYNPTTDTLTVTTTTYRDGGRTAHETTREYRLVDVDQPTLADAMEQFDPMLFDEMSDDDSLVDWRVCFRSMFMRMELACDAENNREVLP